MIRRDILKSIVGGFLALVGVKPKPLEEFSVVPTRVNWWSHAVCELDQRELYERVPVSTRTVDIDTSSWCDHILIIGSPWPDRGFFNRLSNEP